MCDGGVAVKGAQDEKEEAQRERGGGEERGTHEVKRMEEVLASKEKT